MKAKVIVAAVFMGLLYSTLATSAKDVDGEQVRASLRAQMREYPLSTLQDIYKNFFQDRFGPGHIVSDEASALSYLNEELQNVTVPAPGGSDEGWERLGWEHNFVRVDLWVIPDKGIVPEAMVSALMDSAFEVTPDMVKQWKGEWAQILSIIKQERKAGWLVLPDFSSDKKKIAKLLRKGEYVVHHSEQFSRAYEPHYRVISEEIFNKKLKTQIQGLLKYTAPREPRM